MESRLFLFISFAAQILTFSFWGPKLIARKIIGSKFKQIGIKKICSDYLLLNRILIFIGLLVVFLYFLLIEIISIEFLLGFNFFYFMAQIGPLWLIREFLIELITNKLKKNCNYGLTNFVHPVAFFTAITLFLWLLSISFQIWDGDINEELFFLRGRLGFNAFVFVVLYINFKLLKRRRGINKLNQMKLLLILTPVLVYLSIIFNAYQLVALIRPNIFESDVLMGGSFSFGLVFFGVMSLNHLLPKSLSRSF